MTFDPHRPIKLPIMSDTEKTITLITGPNRGIGNALITDFLQRTHQLIIASVRDPSAPAAQALQSLPRGVGTSLIVVKIDSAVDSDPGVAVEHLRSTHKIERLDCVIANAGIGAHYGPVLDTPLDAVRSHVDVNALSALALFQAVEPLLRRAKEPKLFLMSSHLSSMTDMNMGQVPVLAYGSSKVLLNFIGKKIHTECDWLTTVMLSPGWVQTAMGQYAALALGAPNAETTIALSSQGLLKIVISTMASVEILSS